MVKCQMLPRIDGKYLGMAPLQVAKQMYPGHEELLRVLKTDVTGGTGSVKDTVAPWFRLPSAQMQPPCRRMIRWHVASPIPVPS